jgi:hypothetical protein
MSTELDFDDFIYGSIDGAVTMRRVPPARWDSGSRNSADFPWCLLNLPQLSATRVDTQCHFCDKRIWRGQDRFKFSTPWSRIRRQTYFNLHQHCYYALIHLSIEKLRKQLPSNM